MTQPLAIVGGGASGTLAAVALASRPDSGPVILLDAEGAFARGVAYSTEEPAHLLNIPAGRMSALPDRPSSFLEWLAARGLTADPEAFVERRLYGDYLQSLLDGTGDRVRRLRARVRALQADGDGVRLDLEGAPPLRARAAVLALGNFRPGLPAGWAELPEHLAWRSPWRAGPWPPPDAEVLVLGAGLTAVDVVLSLQARAHRGRIHLLSRRGLLPATHPPRMFAHLPLPPPPRRLRPLVRMFRDQSARADPRAVLDSLRTRLPELWLGLSADEQGRFLRHLRRWFDVVRHRLAPSVGAQMADLQRSGRLVHHAGRLLSVVEERGELAVRYRPRGSRSEARLLVGLGVPSTGPGLDVRSMEDPLVRSLLASGQARPGPHGLGLATAEDGAVLGSLRDRLWTLGGLRRGDLWETTAIIEIRVQARALAATVLSAAAG